MSFLSMCEVSYRWNGHPVLGGLSFDLEAGETLVLLGRSGSGKTTALRLINRLLEPSSGSIVFERPELQAHDAIALRRHIGYVIQDVGLLPHWTIAQNVALAPRLLGWSAAERDTRVRELLDQVGLPYEQFAQRYPHQLSGGQRQRVGVARALAARPSLLLFDEPFGALDPVTRREMQVQFLELRKQYGTTSVFVTHDIAEALILGTRIAVLDRGRLETIVTPIEFPEVLTPVARAFFNTLMAPEGFS